MLAIYMSNVGETSQSRSIAGQSQQEDALKRPMCGFDTRDPLGSPQHQMSLPLVPFIQDIRRGQETSPIGVSLQEMLIYEFRHV